MQATVPHVRSPCRPLSGRQQSLLGLPRASLPSRVPASPRHLTGTLAAARTAVAAPHQLGLSAEQLVLQYNKEMAHKMGWGHLKDREKLHYNFDRGELPLLNIQNAALASGRG